MYLNGNDLIVLCIRHYRDGFPVRQSGGGGVVRIELRCRRGRLRATVPVVDSGAQPEALARRTG